VLLACTVIVAGPDSLRLEVTSRREIAPADPRVVVVQALPKGDRAELAVEMLTELGVDEIVPWAASRSIAQWRGPRGDRALERWRRTAREAAKQSRRAWVPPIAPLLGTAGIAARLAGAAAVVLHEAATAPLASLDLPASGELIMIVGPEGGIAADELDAFTAAGAHPIRLGGPVLRTSTAGAAALVAVSLRLGRWG
jgi:16S rRNA (uracil1498-N3)-methyltransferase